MTIASNFDKYISFHVERTLSDTQAINKLAENVRDVLLERECVSCTFCRWTYQNRIAETMKNNSTKEVEPPKRGAAASVSLTYGSRISMYNIGMLQ